MKKLSLLLLLIVGVGCNVFSSTRKDVHIYSKQKNDLCVYLQGDAKLNCLIYSDVNKLLSKAKTGDSILILAKNYPLKKVDLPKDFYTTVKRKKLKAFVEFPNTIGTEQTGKISRTHKERMVVSSDKFGLVLPKMTILDAGMFSYVPVKERTAEIRAAKVAGFDIAQYGLKNTRNFPVLFDHDGVIVCSTKISDFNKSRYSPIHKWKSMIKVLLQKLDLANNSTKVDWTSIVRPSFSKDAVLNSKAYSTAIQRGADWYIDGRMLIHPSWKDHWWKYCKKNPPVGPPMDLTLPSGDGSLGVIEGHCTDLNVDGSQKMRYWLRADCVSETAMTLAMAQKFKQNGSKERKIANNLLKFLFKSDTFHTPASQTLGSSAYGLMGWANTHKYVYYGDDNARVILGSILATQALGDAEWNEDIVKLIIANFLTTGANGFRRGSFHESKHLTNRTLKQLQARTLINPHPHFESWLWSTYLWLYDKTGQQELLDLTKKAISITMEHYPNRWKWTNGIQQERARMILPLAWLVRVEDTPLHRKWLNMVVSELLKSQVACGAIREEIGTSGGQYGPPKNNAKYGTAEAPIIFKNGQPVADMLYTSNFAFFALNEAAAATKNPVYQKAVDKLADFLVRIQTKADNRADLDGTWFRAFEYKNWEFYGTNGDHGWGAWGTLTGWTQSFITTTLALKQMKTSFWDYTDKRKVKKVFDQQWDLMNNAQETDAITVKHVGIGKKLSLTHSYAPTYTGGSKIALINGKLSKSNNFKDSHWQATLGQNFQATIDLGKTLKISDLSVRFLEDLKVGIRLPKEVTFSISTNGKTYTKLKGSTDVKKKSITTYGFKFGTKNPKARYIRVDAVNPGGLVGRKGTKSWLFTDEIIINKFK
ncbi:MAG: discoidin domain-containing protein [Lentisphaeria bacterium]|nr:discoidin domain-containing protein [Lentisphaeria bacterium]